MDKALEQMVRELPPKLSYDLHKGQAGRIGIIGGCKEYTGAPYFAAISAMKVGADLAHVFTTPDAAPVIKSYSPELIVHPLLGLPDILEQIDDWLPRLHSLVFGPGLGRDPERASTVERLIRKAKERDMPIVVDADGMYFLTLNPSLVQDYTKAILTPNAIEFGRFYEALKKCQPVGGDSLIEETKTLATALGHVTVVRKGKHDIITNGKHVITCEMEVCPRRCGGQGDLLSGSLGTFTYWAHRAHELPSENELLRTYGPTLCAAYSGCLLTRLCAEQAFKKHHRSMMTTDMIAEIGSVFHQYFEPS